MKLFLWACAASFFAGSIPTAYLFGRILKNTDIRKHGSGNVGATNAFRVLGKAAGAGVLALDFLKGALPVVIFRGLGQNPGELALLLVGLGAILGHIFTPFLGFKGGKGIATGAGVLCAADPALFAAVVLLWLAVFFCTKIVSLSSLAAAAALPLLSLFSKKPLAVTLFFSALLVIALWTHRSNLSRLLRGEENL